jgi:predicted RNase H-like HicB family nuclease
MNRQFTLQYWLDDGWYAGRLLEVPGVISQARTLEELKDNIRDAYKLMMEDELEDLKKVSKEFKELELTI